MLFGHGKTRHRKCEWKQHRLQHNVDLDAFWAIMFLFSRKTSKHQSQKMHAPCLVVLSSSVWSLLHPPRQKHKGGNFPKCLPDARGETQMFVTGSKFKSWVIPNSWIHIYASGYQVKLSLSSSFHPQGQGETSKIPGCPLHQIQSHRTTPIGQTNSRQTDRSSLSGWPHLTFALSTPA